MELTPQMKSDICWLTLVGGVIAYDVLSDQTMSERFDEYLEHPVGKYIAIGSAAIIGYHLFNLAEHFDTPDPVHELANIVTKIRGEHES